ncbi:MULTISPECIES: GNAT family N-acetyltransferase [unclassified Kitasatospora]|uniref:GNAT family N-acetyltransferase n=1 Tax=unclassified Kitasatospora TaxID=2633591 RepID=UPI000708A0B1|nr:MULTISPECIES: GNAT family N-acetyltransferase [unclassified Kitasatospora]KQV09828.1 acetyltransferase [Kitasatospora sp. Root107]KRB70066.1 acetyltransferase [Kitasatospora sp. Root187]
MSDHSPQGLPAGYRTRAATAADLPAIHQLVVVCEEALYGAAETDLDTVAADLARPGLVPALDTVLVHAPTGELVGRAWVDRRSEVDVHPAHRGLGIGGSLLAWVEARARQVGTEWVAQTVPDDDLAAVALVREHGYRPMVTSWLLGIELPTEPVLPEPAPGITVRPFRPGDEHPAYLLTEDAFDEWQSRRRSYEEWALLAVERSTFAPEMSSLAFADGQLVGAVLALDVPDADEGYIERVAVRSDQRNRGIARLLLQHTFREFHRQGRTGCTLWTHSATGALTLYQRVGMTVRRSSTVHKKALAVEQP